jgi:hypothetical protein
MQSGIRFEWDESKDRSNRRKHGLSFATGAQVFDDPRCVTRTDRTVDGEERLQTFGILHGLLLVMVAHTLREETEDGLWIEVVRIISVRYATPHERRFYEEENG